MAEIDYKPVFRELQSEVASILSESQYFKDRNITVLCEDSLEIEFEIKKALGQQGLVAVVNMLQASYLGHDGMVNAYQIDNLELDIVENPSVWRPYLKKKGIQDGTTTDIMQMAAEILGGPQSGIFGRFNPKSIEIGEDSDLVVGKAKFQTTVRQNVEGIIPEPGKPEIPFITKVELKELLDEIDYLKDLVEGFSTDEIKQDIEDLKAADSALGARIDGLGDIYQPKGSYALTSDLEPYALKTQIPVNTSQLNNDAGFLTQVSWDEVGSKPALALASDIPTHVSQLENDSNYLTSVNWSEIQDKPDIPENIPTKTSDLVNDSGFITGVTWNEVQGKPDLVDDEKLNEAVGSRPTFQQVDSAIDEKIADIPKPEDVKKLWNDMKTQYISGSREVFEVQTIPAHYTEWEFSDGIAHMLRIVEKSDHTWCIQTIDTNDESTRRFSTEAEAHEFLTTTLIIEFIEELTATRQYVEEQQTVVKIADLATTNQIPTKTSDLTNDSGFITSHQSLDGYATEEYVDGKTEAETAARQEAVEQLNQEIRGKASAEDIPTKTSELQNDSGFLTEHQSLEGYATTQYVDDHVPEEFPWNKVSGKPDLVQKDQFDAANKNLQDQIDEINVEIEGQVEVSKVYGQYKARYIDGDGNVFEKQEDGSYSQTGTLAKTSDLRTKTSQLENDSGFLTEVSWDDVSQKPFIPTKLSDLQNDEGFLKDVSWEQVQNKPDIPTGTAFEEFKFEVNEKIEGKLDIQDYDRTAIRDNYRKIDASGNVYDLDYTPGYYTPWTYSDETAHDDPIIYGNDETGWYLGIDQDTWVSTQIFETQTSAQNFLDSALEIEYTYDGETMTASREYVGPQETWTKADELAYESDLPESWGISEEECRTIVEGYGYQTSDDVESAITSKGYRTEQEVESQITAKGYQTETQVQAIAAAVLPAGYVETELVGTLEDGTEMSFTILTKANS